jgi:hypothetical protein
VGADCAQPSSEGRAALETWRLWHARRWADDFARLQLHARPPAEAWAADFQQQQQQQQQGNGVGPRSRSWGRIWDDSAAADSADWASDFAAKASGATVRCCAAMPPLPARLRFTHGPMPADV